MSAELDLWARATRAETRVMDLKTEVRRLQCEVANRNQRALAGDEAVAANEKLLDEIEQQAERIAELERALAYQGCES